MRKTIRDAIVREATAARDIAATAEREERPLTDVEQTTIDEHMAKAEMYRKQGTGEVAFAQKFRDLTDGLGGDDDEPEPDTKSGFQPQAKAAKNAARMSIGQQFVESPEWTGLLAATPGGVFGKNRRVQSPPVQFKDLLTGADHDTSAGALLRTDYRGMLDPFYQRPLTVRDLVASGTTTTDTIEYVRLISVTNNAAPVAEATSSAVIGSGTPAVTDVEGGLKPESGMEFEKDTTVVKTIAHWIPATKRSLSDPAQVRTMIDAFLRYGLEEELEDQLVAGDGVGENFLGLANISGVQNQAAPAGGQDVFDITRMARRKVRIGGRAIPTAYVFNPIDWEAIELRRDGNQQFYAGGPFNMATPRLWGLPVVESEAIPAGTAYVGDWKQAVLWDREQASVQATDAHADFFIRNLVAILAEMRAAFAVLRPAAFVRIDLA